MDSSAKKVSRLKFISIGNVETGKSCLIKRYCEKRFVSKYMPTIGVDFGVTKVTYNDRRLKINLFDLSGHPSFAEVSIFFCLYSVFCNYVVIAEFVSIIFFMARK